MVFTRRAERQLIRLYSYIADHRNEERAEKFVGGVVADCHALSVAPERGTKREDIRPGLRYLRRLTNAFSVNAETSVVAVHGIFYGGQDFERVLGASDRD